MPGPKKDEHGLTEKQRRYAENRAAGMSQPKAYKSAGYSSKQSDASARVNACRLEANTEAIQEHMNYLKEIAETKALETIEERKAALYDLYHNSTNEKIKIKALDLLNRMNGDYIDKKEITANVGITREDRRQAMQDTLDALKQAWDE